MAKRILACLVVTLGLGILVSLNFNCGSPSSRYAPLFVNNTFHLCCNMYYPAARFNDVNYQYNKTFIPLGTQVKVLRMTDIDVTFVDLNTNRQYTWIKRYARAPFASLLKLWFINEDPREIVNQFDENVQTLIYSGKIEEGMTKQQVIYALGFPPHHKTPDTSLDKWIYWSKNDYKVNFSNGIVTSVVP